MTRERRNRRLSAILAADVAGYTRLIEQDTEGTVAAWEAARSGVIDPMIDESSGAMVKLTGDGFLAEFSSVQDAVECAVKMLAALAGSPLDFRVGVSLGDVVDDGRDIHGEGVNLAARIEGLAEPGGLCVSNPVYEAVRHRVGIAFRDAGEHALKNVSVPVRVWSWSPALNEADLQPHDKRADSVNQASTAGEGLSVAVLPFNSMGAGAEHEFLADGITEDIITELSRIRGLFVVARHSTFAYKGQSIDIRQVATELGVRYVLEGSVRVGGNRIRVSAQLVEGENGNHVWAERFDRVLEDVFAIQDEITEHVVSAIEPSILAAETHRSARLPPTSLDAWGHVVQALPLVCSFSREKYGPAEAHLNEAIRLDPDYARAHALLATGHVVQAWMGWGDELRPREKAKSAQLEAERAVELDPQDPWAHMALGFSEAVSRRTERGLRGIERALELNPNFTLAYAFYSIALTWCGRPDEALEAIKKARRTSPRDPITGTLPGITASAYLIARRYEECIEETHKAIRSGAAAPGPLRMLAAASAHLGRLEAARAALEEAYSLQPTLSATWMRENFPFARSEDLEVYIAGLKLAGMRED